MILGLEEIDPRNPAKALFSNGSSFLRQSVFLLRAFGGIRIGHFHEACFQSRYEIIFSEGGPVVHLQTFHEFPDGKRRIAHGGKEISYMVGYMVGLLNFQAGIFECGQDELDKRGGLS